MSRLAEAMLPEFGGVTYSPTKDGNRLSNQLKTVLELMKDGRWRTLAQIAQFSGGSEAAISARLRDLRKPKFGTYTVNRRRVSKTGLWEYQVT